MDLSALGVLRPIAQNLTRRGYQSESKGSISSAPDFLAVGAKQGEMPLFFMAVGGRGAARETNNRRNIFHQSEPWHFSANPRSKILSDPANPSSRILSDGFFFGQSEATDFERQSDLKEFRMNI